MFSAIAPAFSQGRTSRHMLAHETDGNPRELCSFRRWILEFQTAWVGGLDPPYISTMTMDKIINILTFGLLLYKMCIVIINSLWSYSECELKRYNQVLSMILGI